MNIKLIEVGTWMKWNLNYRTKLRPQASSEAIQIMTESTEIQLTRITRDHKDPETQSNQDLNKMKTKMQDKPLTANGSNMKVMNLRNLTSNEIHATRRTIAQKYAREQSHWTMT